MRGRSMASGDEAGELPGTGPNGCPARLIHLAVVPSLSSTRKAFTSALSVSARLVARRQQDREARGAPIPNPNFTPPPA